MSEARKPQARKAQSVEVVRLSIYTLWAHCLFVLVYIHIYAFFITLLMRSSHGLCMIKSAFGGYPGVYTSVNVYKTERENIS